MMRLHALALAAAVLLPVCAQAADPAAAMVRGRVEGYRGLFPFHVAVLRSRDLADPGNPVAWATVDPDTGHFDIAVPGDLASVYLVGQLDRERSGPRLNGQHLFFLKKLPVTLESLRGMRLIFDLGDMELAHVMRDSGAGGAPWIALGLALLLYGIGVVWYRRLKPGGPPPLVARAEGGVALLAIAAGTTLPLLINLGSEAVELLEFTYLHEGLRPESVFAVLFDPISAELSHPPLWPLTLRAMAAISRSEWWLRLPSVLFHLAYVVVCFRLVGDVAGRRSGLVAALVAGLLPVGFYYGRDATPYALLALISGLAAWCAVRQWFKRFAVVLVVGFFTHYTIAVLGFALGLSLFWASRDDGGRFRRALVAFGWVIPIPIVWSIHFIRTFLASGMSTKLMSVDYLPDPGFFDYVSHFGAVVLGLPPELRFLLPVALGLAGWGAVQAVRFWPLLGRIAAVQLVMVVGYVLFVHAMYMRFASGRVFYAYRWSSVFLPAVAVCYAAGLTALYNRQRIVALAVGALLLGGAAWQDGRIVLMPQRPDQWAAADQLRTELQAEDAFCALPAVYYGQLFNYALFDRRPADLMAWPRWTDDLYGPLHPRNTSIETLSRNLAFKRVWVAAFDERMFGTRKFDPTTSLHQLAWMKEHLVADGQWSFSHLTLYRFKVPPKPELVWKDGALELDFSDQLKLFRYFPEQLHTQMTGRIMSIADIAVRLPSPPGDAGTAALEIEMATGAENLGAEDLRVEGIALTHEPQVGGGIWRGTVEVTRPLIELRIIRSKRAAKAHRNTYLRVKTP